MNKPSDAQKLGDLMSYVNSDDADSTSEKIIYHYASLPSFLSILNTNRFWATNYRFLNDSTEVVYGRRRLIECVRQLSDDDVRLRPYKKQLTLIAETLNSPRTDGNRHLFFTSFTELFDDVNCWRNYGDNGFGVCIGLRISNLVKTYRRGDEFGVDLRAVRYTEGDQVELVRTCLTHMSNHVAPEDQEADLFMWAALPNLVPAFKQLAFKSEAEWRLVVGNSVNDLMRLKARELKFRVRDRHLIPYVDVDISPSANLQPSHPADRIQTSLLPISEVLIGSRVSERDEIALRMALEAFGHSNVGLRRSGLPMA